MNPYGLVLALAVFVGYFLTAKRAKDRGLSQTFVWDSLPWVLLFGVAGARLYHVVNFWDYYLQHLLLIPQVWLGGLGILGGLGGGLVGFLIYFQIQKSKIKNQNENSKFKVPSTNYELLISSYFNAAAPGIALAQAIGRVGNIFNGENLPYAYWEMGLDLLIFLVILLWERFGEFGGIRPASTRGSSTRGGGIWGRLGNFKLYLLLYSLGRFGLEFFRRDSPWVLGALTVAQWVCLGVVLSLMLRSIVARTTKP